MVAVEAPCPDLGLQGGFLLQYHKWPLGSNWKQGWAVIQVFKWINVLNEVLAINIFSKQELTKLNLHETLPLKPVSVEPVESIQAKDWLPIGSDCITPLNQIQLTGRVIYTAAHLLVIVFGKDSSWASVRHMMLPEVAIQRVATVPKWRHSQATLHWHVLLFPYALKHNSINLSEELWVSKSKLTKQSLTFGASKCCFTVARKSAAGERRVSEVCELSDEPQLSRLKQWPLCVYKKMVTVCSLCVAHSPCAKLIIQMARMINLRTRHLHVEIHLPPAARRVGSTQLVSASRKTSSVNSSTTRLCWSFQWDQRP